MPTSTTPRSGGGRQADRRSPAGRPGARGSRSPARRYRHAHDERRSEPDVQQPRRHERECRVAHVLARHPGEALARAWAEDRDAAPVVGQIAERDTACRQVLVEPAHVPGLQVPGAEHQEAVGRDPHRREIPHEPAARREHRREADRAPSSGSLAASIRSSAAFRAGPGKLVAAERARIKYPGLRCAQRGTRLPTGPNAFERRRLGVSCGRLPGRREVERVLEAVADAVHRVAGRERGRTEPRSSRAARPASTRSGRRCESAASRTRRPCRARRPWSRRAPKRATSSANTSPSGSPLDHPRRERQPDAAAPGRSPPSRRTRPSSWDAGHRDPPVGCRLA